MAAAQYVAITVTCLHIMVIVLKDSWRLEADLMHVGTAMRLVWNSIQHIKVVAAVGH